MTRQPVTTPVRSRLYIVKRVLDRHYVIDAARSARPSSVRRKGCIHALRTVLRSVLWPPLSDLDLPVFAVFPMITDRAGQAASHASLTALSAMLLPAAAIAAVTQPGFEFDETEAA